MSLALAGQFTSKFSGRRHDTKVMNLGSPPTGTDPTFEVPGQGLSKLRWSTEQESSRANEYDSRGCDA